MFDFLIHHKPSTVARGIENLIIKGEACDRLASKTAYRILTRLISVIVFPTSLSLELIFKQLPKLAITKFNRQYPPQKYEKTVEKIHNLCLGLLFSPLGIRSPDSVSGLFLKSPHSHTEVRPFGVEGQFGKNVEQIHTPESVEEIQALVKKARHDGKQISIIGAGMSQGIQTVPADDHRSLVINTKKLNQIEFGPNNDTVKVQAGATWEQIQVAANQRGKSVLVKQASDLFSIGGSIGINCHGWAHEYGSLSSTVESLDIIDANGKLKTLTPKDELFGCFFGTLGYFGVVVSATLKLTNNEYLVEKTTEVNPDDFIEHYKNEVKNQDIPLFGGRLVLDNLDGNPLRQICMVSYKREANQPPGPVIDPHFKKEPTFGTRFERIALQALSHLSYFTCRRLISQFWYKEKQLMFAERKMTRNEALHPPINAFRMLHHSNLHAQWLQEYFITEKNLPNFLRFLGAELKANQVRLINATIRPTPQDKISILPYAEQDRYAVVICFSQLKTKPEIEKTKRWMSRVNNYVIEHGDVYYQAYMPFTTQEQFEKCYGKERIQKMRELKQKYDPSNLFGNGHTRKYFDINPKVISV